MKETVMQFGEGNFLRGFVDYFFHNLNQKGLYEGKVVIVQPIEKGLVSVLNQQNGTYNLFLRGVENGKVINEHTCVTAVSRGIDPYTDFKSYMELASNPDLRVIISNTTEAGIEYLGTEKKTDAPPQSYPAKLTVFLYKRFELGLKGFLLFPCELIDNNADQLKDCVLRYADLWELGDAFKNWLETENYFCNTLVDRICTGYPTQEAPVLNAQIGYEDQLLDTAEIFHLWVIEGDFEEELPFQKAGYNIVWTKDVTPYKTRKVRILNGGHTSMVLAAYLYGLETVGECLKDPLVYGFLHSCLFDEIIPTLGNTPTDIQFGEAVLERFSNPFIQHKLLSIALNSVSKFKVRVLPSLLAYREQFGKLPAHLTFSLAALLAFYKTEQANDLPEVVAFLKQASPAQALANKALWDMDLSFMRTEVEQYYNRIQEEGIAAVIAAL